MSSIKSQVVSGVKWSLLGKFISQIFSWVVTFIVIRILTPEDYGIIELSGAMITLGIVLGVNGFSDVIVQDKNNDENLYAQILTLALAFNGALFLLFFFSAGYIASWYDSPQLEKVIRFLSLNILFLSFSVVPAGILKKKMDFKKLSLIQLAQNFVNSISTLILALLGFGYWAIAIGGICSAMFSVLMLNIYARSRLRLTRNFNGFSRHFHFGFFTMTNRLLNFIFLKADSLIIGKMLGTTSLGYYSVGSQLANLPLEKVAQTLNQVSFVGYAKVKEDKTAISYYFIESSRIIALFSFSVFWGLASISEPLISVLLGEKWLKASLVFQVLALVMPLRIYQLAIDSAIAGIGHPKFNTRNYMVLCVVIPLGVVLGLHWGLTGAAIGWSIGYVLFFIWMIARSLAFLSVSIVDFIKCLLFPMLAGLIMLMVNHFIFTQVLNENTNLLSLLCLVGAGACSFVTIVLIFERPLLNKVKSLL